MAVFILSSCGFLSKASKKPNQNDTRQSSDSISIDTSFALQSIPPGEGWVESHPSKSTQAPSQADTLDSDTLMQIPDLQKNKTAKKASNAFGISVEALPADLRHHVRVGIEVDKPFAKFFSLGRVDLLEVKGDTVTKLDRIRGSFTIQRSGNLFEVLDENSSRLAAATGIIQVRSVNPYNLLEVEGIVYRGTMEACPMGKGNLVIVNVLDMEDYLRGVVPKEMGTLDRSQLEALKAQAIAARTYAFNRLYHPAHTQFDLYRDVNDQVYSGRLGEYLMADRAIKETKGIVVLYADTLAQCFYHSTCGGHTANKQSVWGGEKISYLLGVSDVDKKGISYCKNSKYSTWYESWERTELHKILKENLASARISDFPDFSQLQFLQIADLSEDGRIKSLKISTDRGDILVFGDRIRWALRRKTADRPILQSSWFVIRKFGPTILLEGHGYGHGIGMCQNGAIGRAKAGQRFDDILKAYYTGVRLVEWR